MKTSATPTWDEGVSLPSFPALSHDTEAEILIIGAGLAGLLSAYRLAQEGYRVTLIEKNTIGSGATGMTTAFLTEIIDTSYSDLFTGLGKEKARTVLDTHRSAIDSIEGIVQKESIECEFMRCSHFIYGLEEEDIETLKREQDALRELDAPASFSMNAKLQFPTVGYVEIPSQAKFHPRKFVKGLLATLGELGVSIYEYTEADDIDESSMNVEANGHTIRADWIIVATYEPFDKPLSLFFKKGFYTSYVFEAQIPAEALLEATYEDTMNPYHYFRIDRGAGFDRMIIGGEDHRSQVPIDPEKNVAALEEYVAATFPDLDPVITKKWKGPILEPIDGLAYIGRKDKEHNILYAFGFSGNGMTYSMISSEIFADLIKGIHTRAIDLYDPHRHETLKELLIKGRDFTEEFIEGAGANFFKNPEESV